MSLDSTINLLVAVSDLKLVQSITSAINANLPKTGPLGTIPAGARFASPGAQVKQVSHPQPRIEPRDVFHPTPRIEPRTVYHPQSRVEVQSPPCVSPPVVYVVKKSTNPIKPIWAELPPVQGNPVVIEPKVIRPKVDLIHKGMLLDLFV